MERIAQLRKEFKMSQGDLAKKLDVHQTAVSQWENGRTEPSFDSLTEMCALFDVSLGYLLGHTTNRGHFHMTEKEMDELGALEADELAHLPPTPQQIGRAYEKATPPVQRTVEVALEPYMDSVRED